MKDSFADVLKDMRSLVGNAPPDGRITVDTLEHFYQRLDGVEVARVCYPNRDADAKLIAAAPGLLAAARAALHYMRLHKYADQAWADDLEAAIAAAMTPNAKLTRAREDAERNCDASGRRVECGLYK